MTGNVHRLWYLYTGAKNTSYSDSRRTCPLGEQTWQFPDITLLQMSEGHCQQSD